MKVLAVIAAIGALLYVGYALAFPSATVRYRLTLHAEVEGRPVSGSGVIQVSYAKGLAWLSNYTEITVIDVKGEAIMLDLGARGVLFALLKEGEHPDSDPKYIVPRTFGVSDGGIGPEHFEGIRALSGQRDLSLRRLPLLVRFADIADPKTAQRVEQNNLAASFGPGVALRRATIEITRDAVTSRIDSKLRWLPALQGGYLHGGLTSRSAPLGLHAGDFKTGV